MSNPPRKANASPHHAATTSVFPYLTVTYGKDSVRDDGLVGRGRVNAEIYMAISVIGNNEARMYCRHSKGLRDSKSYRGNIAFMGRRSDVTVKRNHRGSSVCCASGSPADAVGFFSFPER